MINEIIWCNSCIRVQNKPVLWPRAIAAGIVYIRDLMDEEGTRFLDYTQIVRKYGNTLTWLDYGQLLSAVPAYWKSLLPNNFEDTNRLLVKDFCDGKRKVSARIYDYCIRREENDILFPYYVRYRTQVEDILYSEYKKLFLHNYRCVRDSKLRNFQYRFLLGKIFTNYMLHKWGIKPPILVTFVKMCKLLSTYFGNVAKQKRYGHLLVSRSSSPP